MKLTAYEAIADVLNGQGYCGGPFWAENDARRVLKALRSPPPEVALAGVPEELWTTAIEAMIAAADTVDAAAARKDYAEAQQLWSVWRRALTATEAVLSEIEPDVWQASIARRGVVLTINLRTQTADGREFGGRHILLEAFDPWKIVQDAVASRDAAEAEAARLRDIRSTHQWSRRRWVPKSGIGPALRYLNGTYVEDPTP